MNKYFLLIILFGIISCVEDTQESLKNRFEYKGGNAAAKQLIVKVLSNDKGLKGWESISGAYGEPLLDYTFFGCGTQYGLHYIVPIRSKISGSIESYIIYQVEKGEGEQLNLTGDVKDPILFTEMELDQIPRQERFIYSAFFLKWKQSGLKVKRELYDFAEKLNENDLPVDEKEVKLYRSARYHSNSNIAYVAYWINLNGYVPEGANAYQYNPDYLERFFAMRHNIFTTSLPDVEYIDMYVTTKNVDFDIRTFVSVSEDQFRLVIKRFMNTCALDLSTDPGSPELTYQITFLMPGAGSGITIGGSGNTGGSGSGGGGSTGGSISPDPDVVEDPSFTEDKDIMCIYNSLRKGSAMDNMNEMLKQYLGTQTLYRVTYKIEPKVCNSDGIEISGKASLKDNRVVITLNKNLMLDKKALDIAKTIVHETLHAYIYGFLLAEGRTPKEQEFVDTWEVYDSTLVEGGDMQHDIMVRGYLDLLANTLEIAHKDHEYKRFWEYNGDVNEEGRKDFYMGLAMEGISELICKDYIEQSLITRCKNMYNDYKYLLVDGWCTD